MTQTFTQTASTTQNISNVNVPACNADISSQSVIGLILTRMAESAADVLWQSPEFKDRKLAPFLQPRVGSALPVVGAEETPRTGPSPLFYLFIVGGIVVLVVMIVYFSRL